MQLITKVILILSMTLKINSNCTNGCLACNENQKCILCDFRNGFYFQDFTCLKSTIEQCSAIDLNGLCLSCKPHYFVDQSNNKCVAVDTAYQTDQCLYYNSEGLCQYCSGDFFPLEKLCTSVDTANLISLCQAYSGPKKCYSCQNGHLPNYLGNACIPNAPENNCLLYSNVKCLTCPPGFMYNRDYLRIKAQLSLKDLAQTNQLAEMNVYQENVQKRFLPIIQSRVLVDDSCLKQQLQNCFVYTTFDTCQVCQPDYYLENNVCVQQPREAIPYCRIYKNLSECQVCTQGYFLQNAQKCSPVTTIEFCEVYNGGASQSICSRCFKSHYLRTDTNTCQKRTTVDLCEEYAVTQDRCNKCQQTEVNYTLTSDGLKCIREVFNCSVYEASNRDTEALKCIGCVDEYYWNVNEQKCIPGTTQFCRLYQAQADICVECINGYFLKPNDQGIIKCVPHFKQEGCLTYNNRDVDECAVCDEGFIMLNQTSNCLDVNIKGCKVYLNQTQCAECNEGYDLTEGLCYELKEDSNCLVSVNGICQQCRQSFRLISGQCYEVFEYQQKDCLKSYIPGLNNYNNQQCNVCQRNAIPFNQKNHFVCISNDQLEIFHGFSLYSSYCNSYTLNVDNQIVCKSCRQGYIFNGTDCQEECAEGENFVEDYMSLTNDQLIYKKEKKCFGVGAGKQPFGGYYAQDQSFNGTFHPLNFTEQKYFKNDHEKVTNILIATRDNIPFGNPVSSELYILPKLVQTYDIEDLTTHIPKCFMYQDYYLNQNSCSKCEFGYFGKIQNWQVDHCHEYQDNKCKKCIHGMIPSEDGLRCVPNTLVKGCQRYSSTLDKCLQCHSGYYMDVNSCHMNTVENCLYQHKFDNTCWKCKEHFVMNDEKNKCLKEIEHCKNYDLTGDSSVCLVCENNYQLVIDGLTQQQYCQFIPNLYCWFKENGTDAIDSDCLFYQNVFEVTQINSCQPLQTINHCVDYEDNETCVQCENYHYYVNGFCCAFGTFPGLLQETTTECSEEDVENCLTYSFDENNGYMCSQCETGFHLTLVDSTRGKCCPYNQYWQNNYGDGGEDLGTGACVSELDYDADFRNDPNCLVFQNDGQICDICIQNFYKSHNHCCEEGDYYDMTDKACKNIETFKEIPNCLQWSDEEENKCKECDEGFFTNYCCIEEAEYLDFHPNDPTRLTCTEIPGANCLEYDRDKKCIRCLADFYTTQEVQQDCCSQENEYFNTLNEQCTEVDVANVVEGCIEYDPNQDCLQCFNLGFLATPRLCCPMSTFYDGNICQVTGIHYINCSKIEKNGFNSIKQSTLYYPFMCSECIEGTTLIQEVNGEVYCYVNADNCQTMENAIQLVDNDEVDNIRCKECVDGFTVPKFTNHQCCEEGKYAIVDECFEMEFQIQNCFYFDLENFQCADFSQLILTNNVEFTDLLFSDYGVCASTLDGLYRLQEEDTSFCTTIVGGLSDCKVSNIAEDTCELCNPDFIQFEGGCDDYIANCIFDFESICSNCKPGFYSIDGEANNLQCSHAAGYGGNIDAKCTKVNEDDEPYCMQCEQGYYVQANQLNCCRYGYTWDEVNSNCVQIKNDYCNQQTETSINADTGRINCDSCYISTDQCDDNNTLFFTLGQQRYSIGINKLGFQDSQLFKDARDKIVYYNIQNVWYDDILKQCCPHGSYYSTTAQQCEPLHIDNCREGRYNINSQQVQCLVCEAGYYLDEFKCVKISEQNCNDAVLDHKGENRQLYLSNGNCCLEGTMWSLRDEKCVPIVDPFCDQAENEGYCSKCKDNYTNNPQADPTIDNQSLPIIHFQLINSNELIRCPNVEKSYFYHTCVPISFTQNTSIYTYDKIYKKIRNCGTFDNLESKKCVKCLQNSYMADEESGICCVKGEILIENECKKASEIDFMENCYSYDIAEQKCLSCIGEFFLQQGKCCPKDHYIDPINKQCIHYYPDCALFHSEYAYCERCYPGYYMSQGKCCRYGTRWIFAQQKCVEFSSNLLYSCQMGASEIHCAKCIDKSLEFFDQNNVTYLSDVYLAKGFCFGDNTFEQENESNGDPDQYYSTMMMRDIIESTADMYKVNCNKLDDYNNCIQCKDGYNLYKTVEVSDFFQQNLCCPSGYYPSLHQATGIYICQDDVNNNGCDKMEGVNITDNVPESLICTSCLDGYYLTNGRCCKNNEGWSVESNKCTTSYIPKLQNCKQSHTTSTDVCTECINGYYLSGDETNKYCCQEGFYWNTTAKTCLSIQQLNLTNCSRVTQISSQYKCIKCSNTNEIYNQQTQTCETKNPSSAIDTNCNSKKQVGGVYECEYCSDNAYKSQSNASQKICCTNNYFYNSDNSSCVLISQVATVIAGSETYTDCEKLNVDNTNAIQDCTCNSNYFKHTGTTKRCTLVDVNTVIDANCLIFDTSDNCQLCEPDYTLSNANACNQDNNEYFGDYLSNCLGDADTGDCLHCINGTYETKSRCCPENYYWNSSTHACEAMWFEEGSIQCSQYDDNNNCTKCNNSQNFFKASEDPFICCPRGYYYNRDQQSCSNNFNNVSDSVKQCNLFDIEHILNPEQYILQCRAPTDEEKNAQPSLNTCNDPNYYFTNKRCCENLKFYQEGGANCITIYPELQYFTNCKQLDDNNLCSVCKDSVNQYISGGNCCSLGQYVKNTNLNRDCEPISYDSGCKKMNYDKLLKVDQCTFCAAANENKEFPQCCVGKYLPANESVCQLNLPNCDIMNADKTCKKCKSSFYVSNGNCCANGTFWLGSSCQTIPADRQCQQVAQSRDDQYYCSQCNFSIEKLQISDGRCCKKGFIYVKEHQLQGCLPYDNLFEHCSEFESGNNYNCSKCSGNYHLSQGLCCPESMHVYFDNVLKHFSCTFNIIKDCEVQNNDTECSKCIADFYLANNNQTCCPVGHIFINGSCSLEVEKKNCVSFDADGQCIDCIEGHYISTDSNKINHCCKLEEYILLVNEEPVCFPIDIIILTCFALKEDQTQFGCSLGKWEGDFPLYINNNVVTPIGSYLNIEEWEIFPVLQKKSFCNMLNDKGECIGCVNDNYYLTNNNCCPLGRYWDEKYEQCLENRHHWCGTYQDETNDKCLSCFNDIAIHPDELPLRLTTYLIQEHCCPLYHYWNDTTSNCEKNIIQNCERYVDNKNEDGSNNNSLIQCESCDDGFTLTEDQFQCCSDFGFYNLETKKCVEQTNPSTVYEGCIDWNEQSLLCQKCNSESYYLSSSENSKYTLCCNYDQYLNEETGKCADINKDTYPKCTQMSEGNCQACEQDYQLKESNSTCVKIIDHCTEFNAENNTCSQCDKQHYLTQGICCQEYTFGATVDNTKQCVESTTSTKKIEGCLNYKENDSTKCQKCIEHHYISADESHCVTDGKFWNGTSEVDGKIAFCEQYDNEQECRKCIHSHTLVTAKANAEVPLDENLDTESLRAFYNDQGIGTKHFCVRTDVGKCLNTSFQAQDQESSLNQVQCDTCFRNFWPTALEQQNFLTSSHQHYKIHNCKHTITHYLFSLSTFQCIECEYDYFYNKGENRCVLRTSQYTNNCLKRDLYNDKCLKCKMKFSLVDGKCVLPPVNCLLLNSSNQCVVCDYFTNYTYLNTELPLGQECKLISTFANEMDVAPSPDFFKGRITDCEPHHQCTSQFLSNLNATIEKYLSCHVCKDSNRIPFISLSLSQQGNINGIKRYSMWNNSDDTLTNFLEHKENKQSECFKVDFSEFQLPQGQTKDLFPENCAVGVFNSDYPLNLSHSKKAQTDADFDFKKASAFCVECKPGFRPVRNAFFNMVTRCERIDNCKNTVNTGFSQCDECMLGYYYQYDPSTVKGGINRSFCYQSTTNHDENCYVFDEANHKCHTCRNGYSKNHDGKCEKLTTAFCEAEFNFSKTFNAQEFEIAYYRGEQGCTKCKEGYERIYRQTDDFVCFSSSHQLQLPEQTKYVPFCEFYFNEVINDPTTVLKCYKCDKDHILTNKNKCIIRGSAHNNCSVALDENLCTGCLPGFYLINGLCIPGDVLNCSAYQIVDDKLVCNTCNDYYFLNTQKMCQKGEIQFCRVFNDLHSCVRCEDNYQLVNLLNGVHYCMPIFHLDNNCVSGQLDSLELAEMNLKCNTCKTNTILELIPHRKVCARFNLIKNCIKYNRGSKFSNSTLLCIECQPDSYLNADGNCIKRTNIVANCVEYNLNADQCTKCFTDFWLDNSKVLCNENPIGLVGCENYVNQTTCGQCKNTFYLDNGKCLDLAANLQIPGCIAYDAQKQCVKCQSSSTLISQECVANSVQHCFEHETPTSCKVCDTGYGISAIDNLNKCISLTPLTYCLERSQFEPYACLVCSQEAYLLETGQCALLETNKVIPNCVEYNANQLCKKCEPQYALSVDNDKCIYIVQKLNCIENVETKSNFCIMCQSGFKMDSQGTCVQSPAKDINGCFLTKYDKANQCAVCTFGYYMNENYECQIDQDIADNGGSGDGGNNQNGISLLKFTLNLLVLMFFSF